MQSKLQGLESPKRFYGTCLFLRFLIPLWTSINELQLQNWAYVRAGNTLERRETLCFCVFTMFSGRYQRICRAHPEHAPHAPAKMSTPRRGVSKIFESEKILNFPPGFHTEVYQVSFLFPRYPLSLEKSVSQPFGNSWLRQPYFVINFLDTFFKDL